MTRIVICGGPRCGKTSMAAELGLPTRHTDDLIEMGWSEASDEASRWFDEPGPWIVEGVGAVRALRKWLSVHSTGRPCDLVVFLVRPFTRLLEGQAGMLKACRTVFGEIRRDLERRGVKVRHDRPQLYRNLSGSLVP